MATLAVTVSEEGVMAKAREEEPEASYTLREAAERLGVSVRSMRRYVQSGQLEATQSVGRHGLEYRIPASALEAYAGTMAKVSTVAGGKARPRSVTEDTVSLSIVATQLDSERAATREAWSRAEAAWQRIAELEAEVATLRALLPPPRRSLVDRLRGR